MELRGTPLPLLRRLAVQDPDVEDAQMFGDRIHLRVHIGAHEEITNRLEREIAANRGIMTHLQVVPPKLEDTFMELSVMESDD